MPMILDSFLAHDTLLVTRPTFPRQPWISPLSDSGDTYRTMAMTCVTGPCIDTVSAWRRACLVTSRVYFSRLSPLLHFSFLGYPTGSSGQPCQHHFYKSTPQSTAPLPFPSGATAEPLNTDFSTSGLFTPGVMWIFCDIITYLEFVKWSAT